MMIDIQELTTVSKTYLSALRKAGRRKMKHKYPYSFANGHTPPELLRVCN